MAWTEAYQKEHDIMVMVSDVLPDVRVLLWFGPPGAPANVGAWKEIYNGERRFLKGCAEAWAAIDKDDGR
jgi:hypothetical protein